MKQMTHGERKDKMGVAFVKCLLFKLCPRGRFSDVRGFYCFLDASTGATAILVSIAVHVPNTYLP